MVKDESEFPSAIADLDTKLRVSLLQSGRDHENNAKAEK
jgi:hypothetical protein